MDDRCRSASTLRLRMPFLLRELPNFSLGAAYRYRHAGEVPVEPPTVPHHGVTACAVCAESVELGFFKRSFIELLLTSYLPLTRP